MSDSYGTGGASGSGLAPTDTPGTLDTAKQEAAAVTETATEQAKDVLGTAKDEASTVLVEAKSQAKDLYTQTQREVKDQAHTQQQRIVAGLHAVSGELESMAANAPTAGVATDVVGQVAGRLSAAASWLGERDPGSVLGEVKRYARRKPGTFILAAVITGVVVGRLTRALAANASDDATGDSPTSTPPADGDPWVAPATGAAALGTDPATSAGQDGLAWSASRAAEVGDDRSDTF